VDERQRHLPFTQIGADRLALSAAAVYFFPKQHNLVIGMGSCITYNFINADHEFLGGGISPGMEMRFKSLHTFTALLPLVEKDWNLPLVGYDTRTNILSGVILGMAKEIDGMIDAYAEKYGNFNVLLTGGDAPYFVYHLKNKIFADPNLIYKGLYAISEVNNA
jgi:type III pantothenate kinase